MMTKNRPAVSSVAALLSAVFLSALAYFSPVTNTNSDPQFGLLVSQTMLRHQTVQMDIHRETIIPIIARAFVELDGHIFYYFPLGTPLLAMPFVGLANLFGFDMANPIHEAALQNLISAVLVGLSFLVLYRICCHFLSAWQALFLAATAFLGSALISTMSTALWSIDFAVLFVALSLLVLTQQAKGLQRPSQPYLLGFFLFGAYLCRPSTFLFVALVIGYLLLVDRKTFWRTAVFAFVLLAAFLLFIRLGYGSWLPPYYNDFGRLAVERRPLLESLFGNLISPSRGLLIYSPIFLLTLVGSIYFFPTLKRKPLYWLIIVWFLLQLLLVARTTRWWGGLSFGPRILTEIIPGLALLTAMVAQALMNRVGRKSLRIAIVGLFSGLALWAIFLNSYQALFNQYTGWWHSALAPNIDYEPDYLWNWTYPQFLADNDSLCDRDRDYMNEVIEGGELRRHLYPYWPGSPLDITTNQPLLMYEYLNQAQETAEADISQSEFESAGPGLFLPALFHNGVNNLEVLLSGWSDPEFGYRWSMCETATIAFKLTGRIEPNQSYELGFLSGSFREQRVNVQLNGVELGELVFIGGATPAVEKEIAIPPGTLIPGEVNQIVLHLPDSVIPDNLNESRRVGLSLVSIVIE